MGSTITGCFLFLCVILLSRSLSEGNEFTQETPFNYSDQVPYFAYQHDPHSQSNDYPQFGPLLVEPENMYYPNVILGPDNEWIDISSLIPIIIPPESIHVIYLSSDEVNVENLKLPQLTLKDGDDYTRTEIPNEQLSPSSQFYPDNSGLFNARSMMYYPLEGPNRFVEPIDTSNLIPITFPPDSIHVIYLPSEENAGNLNENLKLTQLSLEDDNDSLEDEDDGSSEIPTDQRAPSSQFYPDQSGLFNARSINSLYFDNPPMPSLPAMQAMEAARVRSRKKKKKKKLRRKKNRFENTPIRSRSIRSISGSTLLNSLHHTVAKEIQSKPNAHIISNNTKNPKNSFNALEREDFFKKVMRNIQECRKNLGGPDLLNEIYLTCDEGLDRKDDLYELKQKFCLLTKLGLVSSHGELNEEKLREFMSSVYFPGHSADANYVLELCLDNRGKTQHRSSHVSDDQVYQDFQEFHKCTRNLIPVNLKFAHCDSTP